MATKPPAYRKHVCGQAFVRIKGKNYYLGAFGTETSKQRYKDVLAEYWQPVSQQKGEWPEIEILLAKYVLFAKQYYKHSNEATLVILAMRPLRELFADVPTSQFGPRMLAQVRDKMVASGVTRQGINKRINRLRRIFKWGVAEELVPPAVYDALKALSPLSRGRTDAPESPRIGTVSDEHLQIVLDNAPAVVAAMIRFQLLTACRPGEVTAMRRCDIEIGGAVWIYRPKRHKNQWRNYGREIYLGPQAQALVKDWLPTELDGHVFSPRRYFGDHCRDSYDVRVYRVCICGNWWRRNGDCLRSTATFAQSTRCGQDATLHRTAQSAAAGALPQ